MNTGEPIYGLRFVALSRLSLPLAPLWWKCALRHAGALWRGGPSHPHFRWEAWVHFRFRQSVVPRNVSFHVLPGTSVVLGLGPDFKKICSTIYMYVS